MGDPLARSTQRFAVWAPLESRPQITHAAAEQKPKEAPQCIKGDSWREALAFWWCEIWNYVTPEQMTAVFTFVLGLSTIGLWFATKRLTGFADQQARDMKASLAIAKDAADAAKKSADAAMKSAAAAEQSIFLTETPCLIPEVTTNFLSIDEHGRYVVSRDQTFKYRFKNYGKTPAFIRHINCSILPINKFKSFDPGDKAMNIDSHGADMVPGGGRFSIDYNYTKRLHQAFDLIESHEDASIYSIGFFGRAYYDDIFGNKWIKHFLLVRNEVTGEFTPSGSAYNTYARERDKDQQDDLAAPGCGEQAPRA